MIHLIGQWLGYASSVFLIASFLFQKERLIRYVNIVACLCFLAYAMLLNGTPGDLGSWLWPIFIPNFILILVHLYFLFIKKPADAGTES
jgi:hypothetical protein